MSKRTVKIYDSGIVAAGAEILSPVLNLSLVDAIFFKIHNPDGGVSRVLHMQEYEDDRSTVLGARTVVALRTVPFGGDDRFSMGLGLSYNGGSGFNSIATVLPPYAHFVLLAGGVSNGRIVIWGR